jgi:hypothetical protein
LSTLEPQAPSEPETQGGGLTVADFKKKLEGSFAKVQGWREGNYTKLPAKLVIREMGFLLFVIQVLTTANQDLAAAVNELAPKQPQGLAIPLLVGMDGKELKTKEESPSGIVTA